MKRKIRNKIRELKAQYDSIQLAKMSLSITNTLLQDKDIANADTIMLYSSLPDEVDTHTLSEELLKMGKQILMPVVMGNDIVLRQYDGTSGMKEGAFGIMEPQGETFVDYENIDVVVVPGMAFDKEGNRLGRGKGYYDRFLPKAVNAVFIGICFPFQLLPEVPHEEYDICMNKVYANVSNTSV